MTAQLTVQSLAADFCQSGFAGQCTPSTETVPVACTLQVQQTNGPNSTVCSHLITISHKVRHNYLLTMN